MNRSATKLAALLIVIALHLDLSLARPYLSARLRFDPHTLSATLVLAGVLTGLFWSQTVLLAAWAALAAAPLRLRLPTALAVGLLSFFLWTGSAKLVSADGFDASPQVQTLVQWAVLLLLFLLPCALARMWWGWRIGGGPTAAAWDARVRLLDVLIWLGGVAIVLLLARWLLVPLEELARRYQHGLGRVLIRYAFSTVVVGGLSLPGLAALGVVLHAGRRWVWLLVATGAAAAVALGVALLSVRSSGEAGFAGILLFYLAIEAGLCGSVIGSLLLLIAGGWEMECGGQDGSVVMRDQEREDLLSVEEEADEEEADETAPP